MYKYNQNFPLLQANLSRLTPFQLEIYNILLYFRTVQKVTFISQSYIADKLGCHRKTVSRAIKVLKYLKLLKVSENIDEGHRTLFYELHQDILLMIYNKVACKLLPNLKRFRFFMIGLFFAGAMYTFQKPHPKPNVPQSNSNSFNNSYLNKCKSIQTTQLVENLIKKFTEKKEVVKSYSYSSTYIPSDSYTPSITHRQEIFEMNDNAKPTITPLMREITDTLRLSKAGQVRLLIYDEIALKATLKEMPNHNYRSDKFVWFETYCHGYSVKHNLPIQLELFETMKQRFKIKDDADLTLKSVVVAQSVPLNSDSEVMDRDADVADWKRRDAAGEFDELKRRGFFFPLPGSTD